MKTPLLNLPFLGLLLLLLYGRSQAQSSTQLPRFQCGTPTLSPQQMQLLQGQMEAAVQQKRVQNKSFNDITYVPIRPHIIRRSDGSGGYSMADMNLFMAQANSYFLLNGTGIQFYFCGTTPDFLDDDTVYNSNFDELPGIPGNDATNAMNQYYVQHMRYASGFASQPTADNVLTTRSIISVASGGDLGNYIIPHELGHNFNLNHTFQNVFTGTPGPTDELVTRGPAANCTTAGDLVCDTPADPYNTPGVNILYVNGCYQYDPNSSARDATGDPFSPSLSNLMSYWAFGCIQHNFTPGQFDRMQGGLALRQSHHSYSLNCPPTNVTPPSQLIAYTSPTVVTLLWQDNATNEMGYFIERSTNPTTGFVPIGGVGPNAITYTDTQVTANTQYYYRVRPSNSTTGNLSATVDAFTEACHPTFQNGCSASDGIASVTINGVILSQNSGCSVGGYSQSTTLNTTISPGQPIPFSISFLSTDRAEGVTIWADLNHNQTYDLGENLFVSPAPITGGVSGTLILPASTAPGLLAVRIIAAHNIIPFYPCDPYEAGETEDYQLNIGSPMVSGLTVTFVGSTAQLSWNSLGDGVTYDIQYRAVGSSTWNTISNYSETTYTFFSLPISSTYEWQVRRSGTVEYTGPVQFTTPCPTPLFLNAYPGRATAILSWAGQFGMTYTLRWRSTGTTDWTTINSLASTSYSLTGLSSNTAYEWSVQGICSPTLNTPFTDPASFTTTLCLAPSLIAVTNIGNTSARIYWSDSYLGNMDKTYQIRYRPVGSDTWQLTGIIATQTFTLTGLAGNTPYEWQLQSLCTPTESSVYTPVSTFTTMCALPQGLSSAPRATGVYLSWYTTYAESGTTYDLQYRPTGSPTWTMVSSLTFGSVSLTGLTPNTSYEWRVRTVCLGNMQSDYSAINTFATSCNAPSSAGLLVSYITSSSAQLSWYQPAVDDGTLYAIRWRISGSAEWILASGLSTNNSAQGTFSLTGLSNNTTYEWQISTVCSPAESSEFVAGPPFTTQCQIPSISYYTAQVTTAFITWNQAGLGVRYEIRYRPTGTTDWTTVSSLTGINATLTGLTTNTTYEWQIRTQCSEGVYSDYSAARTFQTAICSPPSFWTTTAITANSAILRWFYPFSTETRYEIRWRPVGTPDWILISNIVISSPSFENFTVALTNLTPGTAYEWQIRALCSATESSGFTSSFLFETLPPCPGMFTVKNGSWADPSVWSCNRIPYSTDNVQIKHAITVPADFVGSALTVHYDPGQKLIFGANARIKLGF